MFKQTNRSVKVTALVLFIKILLPTTFVSAQDYYHLKGQLAAVDDYKGWVSFAGGYFISAASLGFGYGIFREVLNIKDDTLRLTGYLVFSSATWATIYYFLVAKKDTDVPIKYLDSLDPTQRIEFENGYKFYVNKKRKKMYVGISIFIGLLAIPLYLSLVTSRS